MKFHQQHKKYILQPGADVNDDDADGMPVVIDVLPLLDCADGDDAAPVDDDSAPPAAAAPPPPSSTCTNTTPAQPTDASNTSGASSPDNSLSGSTSQQLTAQVAVVQTSEDMEPHYITVTSEYAPMRAGREVC